LIVMATFFFLMAGFEELLIAKVDPPLKWWAIFGANVARIWRECGIMGDMYQPKFEITPELNQQIATIEGLRVIIERSRLPARKEIALLGQAVVASVHSSTAIEGNPLGLEEVEAVLAGVKVPEEQRAILEVKNYKKALDWLRERGSEGGKILKADILTLHRLVTTGLLPKMKAGHWREGKVYIVSRRQGREQVVYTGPEASKVGALVTDLLEFLETRALQLHPVLAAALLHFEFVTIHPFSDGNGRVARLLTMLYLVGRNYDFRGLLIPEVYYLENQREYYQALNRGQPYLTRSRANLEPWLDYFVTGFLSVAQDLETEITLASFSAGQAELRLSAPEIELLSYANQFGAVTIEEAQEIMTETPRRTIQRLLKTLVKKKLLQIKRAGKNTVYRLKK
jgi:Fic family protein